MQGTAKERWKELCEQAAVEQDPKKLYELIAEINRLRGEKYNRLKPKSGSGSGSWGAFFANLESDPVLALTSYPDIDILAAK